MFFFKHDSTSLMLKIHVGWFSEEEKINCKRGESLRMIKNAIEYMLLDVSVSM